MIVNDQDSFEAEIINIISELDTFPCPNCYHRFASKDSLKRHMQKSHLCVSNMNDNNKKRKEMTNDVLPHDQVGPDLKKALTFINDSKNKGFSNQKIM